MIDYREPLTPEEMNAMSKRLVDEQVMPPRQALAIIAIAFLGMTLAAWFFT